MNNSIRIAQEELFSPVACLFPFEDEAYAIEAEMCFVNSQNVRDLRRPFGGTKASGTGREGGKWSSEPFLEPKNVCVSLGEHHIPHWGT